VADWGFVSARLRIDWTVWILGLAGVTLLATIGLTGFAWSDYDAEASGAMRLLAAGDITAFLQEIPAYGGSLVLRAPFAWVTGLLGGGELAVYRALAIPCLLAGVVLAAAIARRMAARGASRRASLVVVALCCVNPIILPALEIGHPEELLCASLAIGAVLAASSERWLLAAILLGLAIATKAWAVLAIGPVLLALGHRRCAALVVAGAVTFVVLLPMALVGSADTIVHGSRSTGILFNPWQIWWPLGDLANVGYDGAPKPGARVAPAWLSPLTHPLIAALVVPLSLLFWFARRRLRSGSGFGEHTLVLLALLLLLRCILDPWNCVYYQLPFLLSLVAWEALCRGDRPPVLTLSATLATWLTFQTFQPLMGPDLLCAIYLAWALPLAAWLARTAFAPAARQPKRAAAAGPRGRAIAVLPQQ
jgi:hypothetical protein